MSYLESPSLRPYRVYKRRGSSVLEFFGAFASYDSAERAARNIGGYVTASKTVWNNDTLLVSLLNKRGSL